MNLKQLKRDISLSKLGLFDLTGKSKAIIDFLNENLTGLNKYASDSYPNWLFFGKSKRNIVLEYNKENGYLYVDNDKIWSLFKNDLYIENTDIQEIIRWWVVYTLKLKVNYTLVSVNYFWKVVVGTLKLKVN